ncbi:MAG: hypothetical protein A3D16_05105 [Rhodobacterales bacterium RIFCSPHIGHO2_02_FULL_62_130]|nr:MAG: hypothetical protein A3D16_05105 [Rhodobacterales bacterium RIFCSPHIGHO2_02_FULL_62_130]OHC55797.1 MAG: hypothetical protein A3E48_02385 [Rhodobacterales bacterium RIFCSPHIGHO2_12_FULL_62_75]HCY99413.1 hypothetical protein [Rhodobacter sp.]
MSYLFPFDFEDDRSEATEIEAHVLVRGGRIVDRGSRAVLALLGDGPVILLLDGPKAGTLAKILHTGIGRLETIWEPTFSELSPRRVTNNAYCLLDKILEGLSGIELGFANIWAVSSSSCEGCCCNQR